MAPGYSPPAPPERIRPATVTLASLLLLLVTFSSLAYLGGRIAITGLVQDALEQEFGGTEMADFTGVFVASIYLDAAVYVLFGLILGVLGPLLLRPRNGVRIATWVVGALGACCGGFSLIGAAFGAVAGAFGDAPDSSVQTELERVLAEELPEWYQVVNIGASLVGVVALLVALLLLALPASNEFFRRPEPVAVPPYPPPSFPQQPPPGYPPSASPAGPPPGPPGSPAGPPPGLPGPPPGVPPAPPGGPPGVPPQAPPGQTPGPPAPPPPGS